MRDKEQIQLKPGQWLDNMGDPDVQDDFDKMLAELGVPKKTYTQAEQDAATAYAARLIKAAMSKPWDGVIR